MINFLLWVLTISVALVVATIALLFCYGIYKGVFKEESDKGVEKE